MLVGDDDLSRYAEFEQQYKNRKFRILLTGTSTDSRMFAVSVWADNGDTCSLQYAGTGALKADVTR